MVHPEPEELVHGLQCGLRQLDGAAEEEAEARPARAELRRRAEREVDLEAAGEEEDAVDRRAEGDVEEVDAVELVRHSPGPVGEDLGNRHVVVDGERQVDVGPAVAGTLREPADDRRADDARVGLRQSEHVVASALAVLDAEGGGETRGRWTRRTTRRRARARAGRSCGGRRS